MNILVLCYANNSIILIPAFTCKLNVFAIFIWDLVQFKWLLRSFYVIRKYSVNWQYFVAFDGGKKALKKLFYAIDGGWLLLCLWHKSSLFSQHISPRPRKRTDFENLELLFDLVNKWVLGAQRPPSSSMTWYNCP